MNTMIYPGQDGFSIRRPLRLINCQDDLEQLCNELRRERIVALDVETTLDWNTLCLLQFAGRNWSAIVDVFETEDLTPVFNILEDPSILIVIHNARFEQTVLGRLGCRITRVFDTLTASRRSRGYRIAGGHSLGAVCRRELKITLDKQYQTSDWRKRPLSSAQINYAAMDAEVLIDLYQIFHLNE